MGDASVSKTCKMPMGSGSMTWDPILYPMKAGSFQTTTELLISSMTIPSSTTITNVTSSNGDKVSCVKVVSTKQSDSSEPYTPPVVSPNAGTTVNLEWSDCGDADTHAKITGFSPTTVT